MKNFLNRFGAKIAVAAATIVTGVTVASYAGADAISSGFTSEGTTLTGYLGDAVVLVISLLGLGAGIRFLVKWVRKAVSAS
jgi:hypothetical protein